MSDINVDRVNNKYAIPDTSRRMLKNQGADFSKLLGFMNTIQESEKTTVSANDAAHKRIVLAEKTNALWQQNFARWQMESEHMEPVDGVIYCSEKAAEWAKELMEREPAMFRQWLSWEQKHIRDSGISSAVLPKGFTEEDMNRWMAKDVLEYLQA
ncbi:MAG: hypothetical protein IJC39_02930 [Firmicutes bacterium]|nr:hypothetical protein [Bacillota bacterium]